MALKPADVVVVGGGVVGCSVAWFLARDGARVALLERDELAAHASGAAAGMLAPVAESAGKGPLLSFGLRSLAIFPQLVEELRERSGIDPELEPSGILHVALDEVQARALRAKAEDLTECEAAWLEPVDARAIEPGLSANLLGALWSPREGHVRSAALTRAYAAAAARCGARIETGVSVTGLLHTGSRVTGVTTRAGPCSASAVVICTGPWGVSELGSPFRLPIVPVRGQILALRSAPASRTVVVSERAYLVPRRDESVWVGASEERVGFDRRVTAAGIERLLSAAPSLCPALADASFEGAWAGLRPATPDHLPVIGAVPGCPGLLVATGHYRNGVLLSAITGRLIADLYSGGRLPDDAGVFSPARFGLLAPA